MNQRTSKSAPPWLVIAVATLVVGILTVGTVNPWPVAAAKLAAVGPGPYIPVSYSYRSMTSDRGTSTYRRQTYVVASQIGKSLSSYRVVEENNVATLEEVRYGLLYGAVFLVVFLAWVLWSLRRAWSR